jgi:mRNA interferase HicA
VRKAGRKNGVEVRFDELRGKGSHGTIYYGSRRTVVPARHHEIGRGLLHSMLRDLGLGEDDLR